MYVHTYIHRSYILVCSYVYPRRHVHCGYPASLTPLEEATSCIIALTLQQPWSPHSASKAKRNPKSASALPQTRMTPMPFPPPPRQSPSATPTTATKKAGSTPKFSVSSVPPYLSLPLFFPHHIEKKYRFRVRVGTEDLTGPIIFTFSAARSAICIASDAAGAVFASPLDGAADAEDLASAEPDSVQQVWVCNRVHGTDKFSLKSHAGRYLSCDKHGILAATKEAISPEEEFDFVRSELGGGRWALRDVRERFIGAEERDGGKVEVRGDREEVGYKETWTVRLQKRNKKRVKSGRGGGEPGSEVKDRDFEAGTGGDGGGEAGRCSGQDAEEGEKRRGFP
jgi:hypothetical protein